MATLHESAVEPVMLDGRQLRWMVGNGGLASEFCSMSVIRVPPGQRARPAHSHPNGEEVIFVVAGHGRVLVGNEVSPVRPGSVVLFPQGVVHMLHNQSHDEMHVVCFFAPPTGFDNYKMFEGVDFPD